MPVDTGKLQAMGQEDHEDEELEGDDFEEPAHEEAEGEQPTDAQLAREAIGASIAEIIDAAVAIGEPLLGEDSTVFVDQLADQLEQMPDELVSALDVLGEAQADEIVSLVSSLDPQYITDFANDEDNVKLVSSWVYWAIQLVNEAVAASSEEQGAEEESLSEEPPPEAA